LFTVIETHRGFPSNTVDYNGCGYPISFDGVVLDSWKLPDIPQTRHHKKNIPRTMNNKLVIPKPLVDEQAEISCSECKALLFASQVSLYLPLNSSDGGNS
jgi:hypothetical protein